MMTNEALEPVPSAITEDLNFMTRRWGELDEACVFELRAIAPDRTKQPQTARFAPDWIDEAVDWATSMNKLGFNLYVTRNPIRQDAGRSATDEDVVAAFFVWADCDDVQASDNVYRFEGPRWTGAVMTGRVPHARAHTYWELEEPCRNLQAWSDLQRGIAAYFGSDDKVVNPSRIMRLGGTVTYPAKNKVAKGYISEMSTIRTTYDEDRDPVPFDQLFRLFGHIKPKAPEPQSGAVLSTDGGFAIDTGPQPLDRDREVIKALSGEDWNIAVFKLIGSYVRKGLSDAEIHALTDPLTIPPYTVDETRQEVQSIIDRTRRNPKFEADNTPVEVRTAEDIVNDQVDSGDWQDMLVRNSRGRAIWNTANALIMMEHDDALKDCFAYDEFKQVKVLTQPLPFSGENPAYFKGRELRDTDITKVVSYFNRIGFPDASKTIAADAMQASCEASTYHPVRNYLNDLPEWDGIERLSHWLQDYCGVEAQNDDHDQYIQQVARRWMISAVARIMRPGCKADGVLILEGKQGALKSTTLRVLSGSEWFGDSLPSLHSKDASDYLRGKWIVEMAELSNINKSEVEVVKAFIAREEERFRPAYGRHEITYPRQCVFAGSTNKTDYLRDETGNRRFWPVRVGDKCDVEGLREDRDQIWSEAVTAFKAGEVWWLTGEAERIAKQQQEERVSQDAWEGTILQYLEARMEVSLTEIAVNALGIETGRVDRASSNRITAILAINGWRRSGQFTSGENKGRAKYIKGE